MDTPYDTRLPPHLRTLKEEIEGYAREYGLDFYETIFEVVDAEDLNEIAAYGGFPTRYPHWSFGMQFEELKKGYDYGLSKIYEMVINNDPCYAYLMRSNPVVDQKLVMAHVYGHCDFFKNNAYFAHTNRKMMDEMANHGARIRTYAEKFGEDEVENFVDRCMSIDDLIDIHSVAIRRRENVSRYDFSPDADRSQDVHATRFKSKDYMEEYINPREKMKAEEEERRKQRELAARAFPERPEKDILLFLIENAPLKNWQRDVLSIIRDEAYYFMPQGQTKILNEGWACVTFGSFVPTDRGFLRMGDVVEGRLPVQVSDGESLRQIVDWATFPDRATVEIRTRRGLTLGGSTTHRVLLPGGGWKRLDELALGERLCINGGAQTWAREMVAIDWQPVSQRLELADVAAQAGVSIHAVHNRRYRSKVRNNDRLDSLLQESDALPMTLHKKRRAIRVPTVVDERLGAFLGYLIGDGRISDTKRTIGLTTADESQADHFAQLTQELFGVEPRKKWDETKWRVKFSSRHVQEFLQHLGLRTGFCAREKVIPDVILRSPKSVMAAFLRALYDCDGHAGKAGVILSTSSTEMSELVQVVLLNFGILSTRRSHKDGCWHVHTMGASAKVFREEIGFGLERKQTRLREYIDSHLRFKQETWEDEVVEITHGREDVYDITVETTHRYVAQGLINHNSYWHSTIMTQKAMLPSEVIDFADHHSGTMAMQRTRLNPYKLGIELLRDVEFRWNTGRFGKEFEECDDVEKKRTWDKQLGLGRQKIFEVRRIHSDITFIDTFLTPEFCVRYGLFSFAYQEQSGQYFIESRDFAKIKERLLFSLTNFGKPWIYVVDGNYRNRGELLLKHQHSGVDLRMDQASDTLANIQHIWGRPVHLTTLVDGKVTTLSFDGTDHSIKSGGDTDDARKTTPAKNR
jgi:stage V sporulation protein R